MRLALRAIVPTVLMAAGVAGACGAPDSSTPGSPLTPSTTSTRTPLRIKVMTFNIQHGIDGTSRYNLQRAIDTIARIQPDIVGLQEVTRNHHYYNCDDQPARIAQGVGAQTGQRWEAIYEQAWFTADATCQTSGRGSGQETEGLMFLSKRSMSRASMLALPNSRIGLEVAMPEFYDLPLVVTHLASGITNGAVRSQQIDRLLGWAAGFGEPRILLGDFNFRPEDAELQQLLAGYRDAWTEALRNGRAAGSGHSKGSTRVDYIFYRGDAIAVESAEVVDTVPLIGVEASDHRPVVATFTVR